jgi:hypothetical protein
MFLSKLKVATAVVLAAGLIAAASLAQPVTVGDEPPKPAPTAKAPEAAPTVQAEASTYRGRVVGPDGQPAAGAKLYLTNQGGYFRQPEPGAECGATGPDGRFAFAAPKGFNERWGAVVVASAAGFGPVIAARRAMRND